MKAIETGTQKGINTQKGAEARKTYSAPALRAHGSISAMKPETKNPDEKKVTSA